MITAWEHHVVTSWQRVEATATGRVKTELKDTGNGWFHHVERVRSCEIEYSVRGFKYDTFVEVSELPAGVVKLLEMIAPPLVTSVAASELPAGSKHTILYNPDAREEMQFHLPSRQYYQFMGFAAVVCFMMTVAGFALYRMGRAKAPAATPRPGPSWSPPQELMVASLPRPIKITDQWVFPARSVGIVGGSLCFFWGVAVIGWLLFKVSGAPGATMAAKWEQFQPGPSEFWFLVGLLVYAFAFAGWRAYYLSRRKAERLLKWGKPAAALVTHVQWHAVKGGARSWESTLEYQDDAGNFLKRRVPVKLSENQVLTVLYDPERPKKSTVYPVAGYEIGEPGSS
jgi:hypothetical protein